MHCIKRNSAHQRKLVDEYAGVFSAGRDEKDEKSAVEKKNQQVQEENGV